MKYFILCFLCLVLCTSTAIANEMEFGEWYGVRDEHGNKQLVGYSGSDKVMLVIYVDKQLITRLDFQPKRKIRLATFDHKHIRSMNFNSLYGYDHWIKRMKKYYRMRVWFGNDKRCEIFSLNGVSKGVNWLHSK